MRIYTREEAEALFKALNAPGSGPRNLAEARREMNHRSLSGSEVDEEEGGDFVQVFADQLDQSLAVTAEVFKKMGM